MTRSTPEASIPLLARSEAMVMRQLLFLMFNKARSRSIWDRVEERVWMVKLEKLFREEFLLSE